MALDKQRILSELGSVVNQLQSADCGCIGKMFSGSTQQSNMGSHMPMTTPSYGGGCRHNCCHNHGNYGSAAGEPYGQMQTMNQAPCMGHCNPPKLYADTYGYLNQNLMQPIVKEVYDDLRTITPANTMTNNSLASQMGLSAHGNNGGGAKGEMGYAGNAGGMAQYGSNNGLQAMGMNQSMSEGATANYQAGNQQQMGNMAGMGPDIVKMIMGDSKPSTAGQPFKLTEPMVLNAPQSPHGKIGVTPLGQNQGQHGMMQGMQGQHGSMQGMPGITDTRMNPGQNNMASNQMMQQNLKGQQITGGQHQPYGQHTQGVTKFNEMFPGVMQGLGGDSLGFDPMAIAIQMNPANQHKSAVDTIHKMLMGQEALKSSNQAGLAGATGNATNAQAINQIQPSNAVVNMAQPSMNTPSQPNEAQSAAPLQGQNQLQQPGLNQMQQQQVYTAVGEPTIAGHQQAPTDSNIAEQQETDRDQLVNQMMKDPILPADTSKQQAQKYYEYNTLGQPVELLPAECYKQPIEALPQTLSPSSHVKSTVSKTSLMGNRAVGRTPSRSQLQHIYHQYKGSQSSTQQNVNVRPNQGGTHSEGRLNAGRRLERVPEGVVEKVGGDTTANNVPATNAESVKRQIGDSPIASKPHGDVAPAASPITGKGRNGLQDVTFTSYPTSTAWSFHGNRTSSPYAYRYNNMNQQRN